MKSLLIVLEVVEHHGDDKSPCGLCKKPVAVLYKVRTEEGGMLTLCRSDLHRVLTMQSQTRKTVAEAEPLFAGGNGNSRVKG